MVKFNRFGPIRMAKKSPYAAPFFSKAEQVITEKVPNSAHPDQIRNTLLNNGVKPEEMRWSGIDDHLASATGRVSKGDLIQTVRTKTPVIREIVKGASTVKSRINHQERVGKAQVDFDEADRLLKEKEEHVKSLEKLTIMATPHGHKRLMKIVANSLKTPARSKYADWIEGRGGQTRSINSGGYTNTYRNPGMRLEGNNIILEDSNGKHYHSTSIPEAMSKHGIQYDDGSLERAYAERRDLTNRRTVLSEQLRRFKQAANRQSSGRDTTKYGGSDLVLPGGENYKEMLLQLPLEATHHGADDPATTSNVRDGLGDKFQSDHWDEPNILAHVRFNDRTGPNGEKLLHLEELQSDWHQTGRKVGYKTNSDQDDLERWWYDEKGANEKKPFNQLTTEEMQEARNLYLYETKKYQEPVPEAPFKNTWHELLLKRMLRYAAEHGYYGISWTPGRDQADRYNLAKHVQNVIYNPKTHHLQAFKERGGQVFSDTVKPEDLHKYLGDQLSAEILKPERRDAYGTHQLNGLDLHIGGEGMKGFYDKIVPDFLNKVGRRFGPNVKVGSIIIPPPSNVHKSGYEWVTDPRNPNQEILGGKVNPEGLTVPYFPITDQMRQEFLHRGQVRFMRTALSSRKRYAAEGESPNADSPVPLQHEALTPQMNQQLADHHAAVLREPLSADTHDRYSNTAMAALINLQRRFRIPEGKAAKSKDRHDVLNSFGETYDWHQRVASGLRSGYKRENPDIDKIIRKSLTDKDAFKMFADYLEDQRIEGDESGFSQLVAHKIRFAEAEREARLRGDEELSKQMHEENMKINDSNHPGIREFARKTGLSMLPNGFQDEKERQTKHGTIRYYQRRRYAADPTTQSLGTAMTGAASTNQGSINSIAQDIATTLRMLPAKGVDAIHATPSGSRPSMVVHLRTPRTGKAVYAASWLGLMTRQPGQLVFTPGKGKDLLHTVFSSMSGRQLTGALARAGIRDMTLIPQKTGMKALIFDREARSGAALKSVASQMKMGLRSQQGSGTFVGASEEDKSREAYRNIIRNYEAKLQQGDQLQSQQQDQGPPPNAVPDAPRQMQRRYARVPQVVDYIHQNNPNVRVSLFESDHNGRKLWRVHSIKVDKDKRGQGIGSKVLQQIVEYADKNGATIALSPTKDFGASSVGRLKKFYGRFGFVDNTKRRDRDTSVSETMIRLPKEPPKQMQRRYARRVSKSDIDAMFEGSLGIKREDAPQMPDNLKERFLMQLLRDGTGHKDESVDPKSLKPSQKEWSPESLKKVKANYDAGGDKRDVLVKNRVTVSKDGYVLDGHHRWLESRLRGRKLNIVRIDLPIRELMRATAEFGEKNGIARKTA